MSGQRPLVALACSYSTEETTGVVRCAVSGDSGALVREETLPVGKATFIARHPERPYYYLADRTDGGRIVSIRHDETTSAFRIENDRSSGGGAPAYVSLDADGRYVFAANADGPTVAILPVENGTLETAADVRQHPQLEGKREPHPHAAVPGPSDRFLYVPDMGLDRVYVYEIGYERCSLRPASPPFVELPDGTGPRHLAVHPHRPILYVINELNSTLTAFEQDVDTGALDPIETVSTLPTDFDGTNKCADVHVHPTGNWVYGSNRGHDSICIFAIDDAGGLERVGWESTRGSCPRDFALDPTGTFLFAENKSSNRIVTFEIDRLTGKLEPTGHELSIRKPVCLDVSLAGR